MSFNTVYSVIFSSKPVLIVQHNIPCRLLVKKKKKKCHVIDIANIHTIRYSNTCMFNGYNNNITMGR